MALSLEGVGIWANKYSGTIANLAGAAFAGYSAYQSVQAGRRSSKLDSELRNLLTGQKAEVGEQLNLQKIDEAAAEKAKIEAEAYQKETTKRRRVAFGAKRTLLSPGLTDQISGGLERKVLLG